MSVHISCMGSYLPYLSYTFILLRTNFFTLDLFMDVTMCTPVHLVEIYGRVFPCTPVFSAETYIHTLTQSSVHAETSVHTLTQSSVHVASVHALTHSSVNVLPQASLLLLPCVCVSMHGLTWASVHVPLQAYVLVVVVTCVCLLLCPTHSCDMILAMTLGQLMYTSGLLLGIPCFISRNLQNVAPCNG